MGTSVKRRPARTVDPNAVAQAIAAVAKVVAEEGAILKSALAKHGVPRAEVERALEALTASGLEVAGRFVRVPIETQLANALARAELLPLRSVGSYVRGATKRDATLAATALVASKRARLVVRTTELLLASNDAPTLAARDLDRIEAAMRKLSSTIKLARRKGGSLLRGDVEEALRSFMAPTKPETAKMVAVPETAKVAMVPEAPKPYARDLRASIDEHRESSGLTWVPRLVRALGGVHARDAVHAELLRAARAGELELRPESGMGRLSEEDAALCLAGPQGSRLSWVRPIERRP